MELEIPGVRPVKQRVKVYQDLFKAEERSSRYSLSGNPGQGKSSFCAKLAYDWCMGKTLQNIRLLFILQLSRMVPSSDIAEAIRSQLLSIEIDNPTLDRIISDSRRSILLVLDGLDETRMDFMKHAVVGNVVKIMRHAYLRDCRVLVTTRPWRLRDVTQFPAYKRLELQKMSKSDVKQFVRKFFNQNEDDLQTVNLGMKLERYIEENKLLVDTSTPMVILLICWYWAETRGLSPIPDRIGELYQQITQIMHARNQKEQVQVEYFFFVFVFVFILFFLLIYFLFFLSLTSLLYTYMQKQGSLILDHFPGLF